MLERGRRPSGDGLGGSGSGGGRDALATLATGALAALGGFVEEGGDALALAGVLVVRLVGVGEERWEKFAGDGEGVGVRRDWELRGERRSGDGGELVEEVGGEGERFDCDGGGGICRR